jgi:hypothetical protein
MTTTTSEVPGDLLDEVMAGGGLSLAAAARLLPASPSGRTPSPNTLARWASRGARRPDGGRVLLETARVGGRTVTTRQAMLRFLASLNTTGPANAPSAPSPGSPVLRRACAHRHDALEQAQVELARRGV